MEEEVPKELAEFEEILSKYRQSVDELAEKTSVLSQKTEVLIIVYRDVKKVASILYQKGSNLAALMGDIIDKRVVAEFRYKLKHIYDLSDRRMYFNNDRVKDIDFLNEVFWDTKPIIIREHQTQKQNKVKLRLNQYVDSDTKDYLLESERSLNANAPKASVVMAGAALERILRKIHDVKVGKSEGIKLWQIMENLERKGIFKNEQEKIILQLCKFFRNFSAHPSELIVSPDLARLIFQSVESLVNSEAQKSNTQSSNKSLI